MDFNVINKLLDAKQKPYKRNGHLLWKNVRFCKYPRVVDFCEEMRKKKNILLKLANSILTPLHTSADIRLWPEIKSKSNPFPPPKSYRRRGKMSHS